ncbi:MAG TPA: DUF4012 domain-containing protein [Anaerolineae bacterium]
MQRSETKSLSSVQPQAQPSRNPAWYLLLGGLLLLLLWLGLKTWHVVRATQSLLASQTAVEQMLAGGLTSIDPDEAEAIVLDVRRDVLTLKNEAAVFMPLTPYLGWLPKVGPTIVAAPHLLAMADAGTETAAYAIRGLKPGLALLQDEAISSNSRLPALVGVLDEAGPDLVQAGLALERAAAARAALGNTSPLPWRVRTLLAQADEWLPMGQDGLKLALVLPEMMGSEHPRRYLLIAQNEDEIRATGGFASGAGLLVVESGRIADLSFLDSYHVDKWADKPYDFPPQPLYELMGLELFLFRDANFWPDFPTSAERAMELYRYGQDVPPFDGVIAIDQRFLQLLLEGTGPVSVPDSGVTINSQNVIDAVRGSWAIQDGQDVGDWLRERKSFMGTFAAAIRHKVESDFASMNPIQLTRALFEALEMKHMQIYVRDPEVEAVLDELNWDGRLENPGGQDFLMVVDTNVGFNKANLHVKRSISYHVDLAQTTPQAHLAIHYAHTGEDPDEPCVQDALYEAYGKETPTYLTLADQCYWNYLRVYAPAGSQLIEASQHIIAGESLFDRSTWSDPAAALDDLPGWSVFSNFLLVPYAQSLDTHFRYRLPDSIMQAGEEETHYRLTIVKQAGLDPDPLTVTVRLPENGQLVEATPSPAVIDGTTVTFGLLLETDTMVTVKYR